MMRKRFILLSLFLTAVAILVAAICIEQLNRTPRELAQKIERSVEGRDAAPADFARLIAQGLRSLDRSLAIVDPLPSLVIGVQKINHRTNPAGHLVAVSSSQKALLAIANAKPGDVITFLPGTYTFVGNAIFAANSGRKDAPIVVRAAQPDTVILKLALVEGFRVQAPYWIVENLVLQGACSEQARCEHAFHIVGNAQHFIARHNKIIDFNSHIKINMENGQAPDDGILEYNTLSNSEVRRTESSVTSIDLVAASGWRIHHNLVSDFVKGFSDKISYGIFVKGGGADNHISQNIVICEHRLRDQPGQRVALSLGGGGTAQQYCRDKKCIAEQDRGVIESNLVMACSDDGIYLNKAAASRVSHNTLIATGGVEVRFAASTAEVDGNLVDGKIRARDGALLRAHDNLDNSMISQYLGRHPLRSRFQNPSMLDLRWRERPDVLPSVTTETQELCAAPGKEISLPGAFDDFRSCLSTAVAIHK